MNTNETQNIEDRATVLAEIAAETGWTTEGAAAFLAVGVPMEDLADILDHLNRHTDGEGSTGADVALAILDNNHGHASALDGFTDGAYCLFEGADEDEAGGQLARYLADEADAARALEGEGLDWVYASIDWADAYRRTIRHGFTAYDLGADRLGATWFAFVAE